MPQNFIIFFVLEILITQESVVKLNLQMVLSIFSKSGILNRLVMAV